MAIKFLNSVAVDTDVLFVDTANEKVGIGTASPTGVLDVLSSDAQRYARFRAPNGEERFEFYIGSTGNSSVLRMFQSDGTTNSVKLSSEGVTYFNGGNVGIGTTSPSEKLDVEGNIKLSNSSQLMWRNAADNGNIPIIQLDATNVLNIGTTSSSAPSKVAIHTGSVERLRIDSSGNVGIGTSSPSATLHVKNTVGSYPFIVETPYDRVGKFISTDSGADLIIQDSNSTDNGNSISVSGDTMSLRTAGSSRVRILANGNVGIGTTSPQQRLQAASPSSTSVVLGASYSSSNNNNFFETGILANDGYLILRNSAVASTVKLNSDGNSYLNGGNVGIGTTSPLNKLHISTSDDVVTLFQSTDAVSKIEFADNNTTGSVRPSIGASGNNTIFTQGVTERMRITSAGNVGIGTTNPNAKLEVRSDGANAAGAEIRLQHANNNTTDVVSTVNFANNIGSVGMIQAGTAGANNTGYIALFTDIAGTSSEKMRIHTNGNVGIGTTSPSTKLDVAGNANISDTLAIGSLSTVPTASLGRALNIQALANSSGTTVAQWLDVDRTITTNSTSANTYGMLLRNASTTTSTANDGNIYGAQIIGRHQGTGGINSAMGVRGTADINTTGTITTTGSLWGAYNEGQVTNGSVTFTNSGIYGTASIAQVLGSGTVNITTRGIVGVGSVGGINNVNANVNRVVAGEFELDLQNGTTEQAHVISLNTYNITSPTNLSIDEFAYIYLGEDVAIPTTVTDNAYFIKSLTSLPSELAGSIEATSFIKTGGTSSQFLKADGSIDSTSYAPATGGSYLPLSAGSSYPLTGDLYVSDDVLPVTNIASNLGSSTNSFLYTHTYVVQSAGVLQLNTGGSERMRIDTSGKVGIGTTSPSQKLTIRDDSTVVYSTGDAGTNTGDLVLQNNDETDNNFNRISFQSTSSNNATGDLLDAARITAIYSDHAGGNPSGELAFETKADPGTMAEAMRIDRDGNVGIGTTSPGEKLEVAGSVKTTGTVKFYNSTSHYGSIYANSEGLNLDTVANRHMIFRKASVEVMRISTSGNVGIGTTSPSEKLEVSGNVKADTLIATDLTDGVIPYHRNGSNGLQNQKMFSDSTNVYIGPASPPNYYSRLTVEGSGIYTTGIEVSGSLTYQEPTAASEFNGEIVTFGTFIETPAAGDLICFNNSLGTSGWREANNSTTLDATGMLGIAVGTTPTNGILIRGFAKSALYNTSNLGTTPAGKKLYIDSVNGLLTTVIPTSNNVRIVGYVVEADATNGTIYFCPDNTYVEIA